MVIVLHQGHLENVHEITNQAGTALKRPRLIFFLNDLMLNSGKTQCIFIGSRLMRSRIPENVVVQFDGASISPCSNVKNLGLHMDRYLTFETHISETSKRKKKRYGNADLY